MTRYKHRVSGSQVEVRDDKVMDPTVWESADEVKKPTRAPARKAAAKKPDEK